MKRTNGFIPLILAVSVFGIAAVVFSLLFRRFPSAEILRILFITFLTVFYHFAMRIAVGEAVTLLCRNRSFRYDSPWLRPKRWERRLYRILRVKHWKSRLITARPEQFNVNRRTPEELLFFMTQAELVHEICMILSFVPLLFSIRCGRFPVFLLTSFAGCLIDGVFAVVQRYNRPRVRAAQAFRTKSTQK